MITAASSRLMLGRTHCHPVERIRFTSKISGSLSDAFGIKLPASSSTPPMSHYVGTNSSSNKRRFSSVDSPADAAAAASAAKLKLGAVELKPNNVVFPWRHETSDNLLPRMRFGSPEYLADVRLPNDIQGMLAVLFLKVPFWKVFMGTSWRDELAESCAFAFGQGTAGILANVYKLPFARVSHDGSIDFQYKVPEAPTGTKENDGHPESNGKDETVEASGDTKAEALDNEKPTVDSSSAQSSDTPNKENEVNDGPDATQMLDRPLRRIFQSAHESGRDQLTISLKSEPKRALLYTIFGVPFLTKARAEADTSLLNRIRDLLSLVREDPDTAFSGINNFISQETSWGKAKMDTTIEMQVLVECEEQFQVHDKTTGVLLQGPEDGLVRTVMHLVRLETNVTWRGRFPKIPSRTVGNWKITDIDDLVGPKKWYHKH